MNRLLELFSGFRESFHFSNPISLSFSRIFARSSPATHYEWKGDWHLYCETAVFDHICAKELLAQGVYDAAIRKSGINNVCRYVNLGANIGAFDVAVHSLGLAVPYALSVELNPRTYIKLNFNLAINHFDSVQRLHAGIGGQTGIHKFTPTARSSIDGLFGDPAASGASIEVPILTLRDSLAAVHLEGRKFDLLKIDCESAEYDIIESADDGTLGLFDNVVMELHKPPPDRSPERVYAKLAAAGFHSDEPVWTIDQDPALRFWTRL